MGKITIECREEIHNIAVPDNFAEYLAYALKEIPEHTYTDDWHYGFDFKQEDK